MPTIVEPCLATDARRGDVRLEFQDRDCPSQHDHATRFQDTYDGDGAAVVEADDRQGPIHADPVD